MIRILVADDHPVVRDGVRRMMEDAADMQVCAEVGTAADLLAQIATRDFDAILLDVTLPDGNGRELIPILQARAPGVPVIMFTNAIEAAAACLAAGANGFVTKDTAGDELAIAIRSAVNGEVYISASAGRSLDANEAPAGRAEPSPHLLLSRRELDVMLRLARGMRPKEIALELDLSPKTVDTYRSRVMKKLRLSDHRGLLMYALRTGLTDWE